MLLSGVSLEKVRIAVKSVSGIRLNVFELRRTALHTSFAYVGKCIVLVMSTLLFLLSSTALLLTHPLSLCLPPS
jgi:hypothetical protein